MGNIEEKKLFTDKVEIKRALISVTDKSGIEILAKQLTQNNIEILSTGGTAKFLKENSIPVKEVSDITNFPEILNGRVKTLHPKIHAGIMHNRSNKKHKLEMMYLILEQQLLLYHLEIKINHS